MNRNVEGFSRRNVTPIDPNDIIELSSDDESTSTPQNYNTQPMNAPAQIDLQVKTEKGLEFRDTYHGADNQQVDGNDQNEHETSSGDELLRVLNTTHGYDEHMSQSNATVDPSFLMGTMTNTMTGAAASATTSPNPNYSAEPQSQFENYTNSIQAQISQNVANDLTNNATTGTTPLDPFAEMFQSSLKQAIQEAVSNAMEQMAENYHLIPKNSSSEKKELNSRKQKRRHHQRSHHKAKKEKLIRYSSASSLDDLFEPSTSSSKYSDEKNSSSKKGTSKSNGSSSSMPNSARREQSFRYDHDVRFGWVPPLIKPSQKQPEYRKEAQKKRTDYGQLKNIDKSVCFTSTLPAALECPLCHKRYKRMVSHFRTVHPNYEVFVSRLSQMMATTLLRSRLSTTKYTRACGISQLKMMCPFCERERDFFVPYWNNHIRTHTGEYTNECIICSKVSLNATHCAQPTRKKKCNLNEDGLSAFLCIRCNYVQIDENRLISHVQIQHQISEYLNEYQKITIIPALNNVYKQINPNDVLVQASTTQNRPVITEDRRMVGTQSSSQIQVLDEIVLQPPIPWSSNGNASGDHDHDLVYEMTEMTNDAESEAPDFYGFKMKMTEPNRMLNDQNDDDMEMIGDIPELDPTKNITMIKVDHQLNEETLKNVYDNFGLNETYKCKVRPWIDYDYGFKLCIDDICQYALYKCMHAKCIFATNSVEKWQIHMGMHHQMMDYFDRQGCLFKQNRDKLIKFRECPYCQFEAKADHQVIRHMEEEHRRSIFQCSFCFYRTNEMDNVVLHMQEYHPKKDQKQILLCGDTREMLQQDEEILDQDCENHIKKIVCGQGDCTEEYVCFNSLYAHLAEMHSGTYECPFCAQTMGLDEPMITEHLSKQHPGFEEFQCLRCDVGFNNVHAIREHMSKVHPSNYLFVGARRTPSEPTDDADEIQLVYVGDALSTAPYQLMKCTWPDVLNGMDPREINIKQQLETLQMIRIDSMKMVHNGPVPPIRYYSDEKIGLNFIKYARYAALNARNDKKYIPLIVTYKCITDSLTNEVPAIEEHINRKQDIDLMERNMTEFSDFIQMIRHRCKSHASHPIVFLQTEQQLRFVVHKIVRCAFECQLCAAHFGKRSELLSHFFNVHPKSWIAARISVKSKVIESNDTQQPVGLDAESFDYFYFTVFRCKSSDCNFAGTRTEAIAHYNVQHLSDSDSGGSKVDGLSLAAFEHIIANKQPEFITHMQEIKNPHQMYLFECQHCSNLFESLVAIERHFVDVHAQNSHCEPRFIVKQLFRFRLGNHHLIRTFAGMMQYASEHPKEKPIPVNIHMQHYCGLCDYNYKQNGTLSAHFEEKHAACDGNDSADGDKYNDAFLHSLKLQNIDTAQCKFASGCCTNEERTLLRQVVQHILICDRRFVCAECPNFKCFSTHSFITHCHEHNPDIDSATIVDNLHNFKAFLKLLDNMKIILPNGLVTAMHAICDTLFGGKLKGQIAEIAQESFAHEKDDFSLMTIL